MNVRSTPFPILLIFSACFVNVALWYFVVHQRAPGLEQRREELRALTLEIEQGNADRANGSSVGDMIGQMEEEASFHRATWERSSDASALYRGFDQIAERSGVRVIRIEPTKAGFEIRRDDAKVSVSGFIVEIQGTYSGVCDFIAVVQHDTGLTRFKSIRLFPSGDQTGADGLVLATMQTEHVAVAGVFKTPEVTP